MVLKLFKLKKKTKILVDKPKFLQGIKVRTVEGEMVTLSDYWEYNTVVLKILRRFGCPLCRFESRLLSELKPEFESMGIKLLAVGFEEIGFGDFISGGYWNWDILIDKERNTYSALALKRTPVAAGIFDLMSGATIAALSAAQKAGIRGDLRGDGFQLGGTFVVEKGTSKLLYEYRQEGAGSYASLKELFEICGGDPDEVEEKAPEECIVYKKICNVGNKCF